MKRLAGIMLLVFCLTGAMNALGESAGGEWDDLYTIFVETAVEYGDLQAEWQRQPSLYAPAPQGAKIALNMADAQLSGDIAYLPEFDAYPALYPDQPGEIGAVLSSGDS